MCARLALHTTAEELAQIFDLEIIPRLPPRYNVAPSQTIAVIGLKADDRTRGLIGMKWGFVPHWANDPKDGPQPVNARSEGILGNSAFRDSVRSRRCIIPASGFYEWVASGKKKIPHYFSRVNSEPFAFAGIWDSWLHEDGTALHTCCILTTNANALVSKLHERMPVILPREAWNTWMSRRTAIEVALGLCQPLPAEQMQSRIVSTFVNKSTNEGPECLQL